MNYIASIAIIFTVSCKKSDEATSEEKFSSFLQNTTQFPGRYIDYVTRNIVKAPLHVAYGLVDCAKYQSDENIVKAIELALIEGIDTWIAPMRKVGKAITNKDIKISRIEKLEENSCRLDIGDKKYHLEVVFVCGDPANQQKCGVRSRAFFPNREGDRDQVGDFSIPPWFYVFNEQWAGNPDVHNSIEGIHIENTSFSKYVLLHELGHVFGLVDTYVVGGGVKTGQPHSIMSSAIPFQNSTGKLTLADDDIRGAQWLYNYFHNKGQLQDCLFPDYEARHDNAYGLMCVPKNVLLDSIKQALSHDAHAMNQITLEHIAASQDNSSYICKSTSDKLGNYPLHLAVIGGAQSSTLKRQWLGLLEELAEEIAKSCPSKFDLRNANQHTALQVAENLEYQKAMRMLSVVNP